MSKNTYMTWGKPMSSREAESYFLTKGFIAAELYEAEQAENEKFQSQLSTALSERDDVKRLGELIQELLIDKGVINTNPISGVELYTHLEGYIKHTLSEKSAYREALEEIAKLPSMDSFRCDVIARQALDRGPKIVQVKDFGAKGDGVTDDSAAIQKAVDSLPEEPVGREELAEAITYGVGLSFPALYLRAADHLLKTFRVERR